MSEAADCIINHATFLLIITFEFEGVDCMINCSTSIGTPLLLCFLMPEVLPAHLHSATYLSASLEQIPQVYPGHKVGTLQSIYKVAQGAKSEPSHKHHSCVHEGKLTAALTTG